MSEVAENIVRERFEVDNDMKAEWCLNKIRKIRSEQQRETAELDRQMDFYRQQKEIIAQKADDDVAFFEGILRDYFNTRVSDGFAKETKTKVSYSLPTGTLVLKHREPVFDYKTAQAETLKWLSKSEGGEQYIKITESLNWAELKKVVKVSGNSVVTKDGEVVPGITVTEQEDEFHAEVK